MPKEIFDEKILPLNFKVFVLGLLEGNIYSLPEVFNLSLFYSIVSLDYNLNLFVLLLEFVAGLFNYNLGFGLFLGTILPLF